MPAIYLGAGAVGSYANDTVLPLPAGLLPGDFVVVGVYAPTTGAPYPAIAGYTELASSAYPNAGGYSEFLFYRKLTGNDPSPVIARSCLAQAQAYRGVASIIYNGTVVSPSSMAPVTTIPSVNVPIGSTLVAVHVIDGRRAPRGAGTASGTINTITGTINVGYAVGKLADYSKSLACVRSGVLGAGASGTSSLGWTIGGGFGAPGQAMYATLVPDPAVEYVGAGALASAESVNGGTLVVPVPANAIAGDLLVLSTSMESAVVGWNAVGALRWKLAGVAEVPVSLPFAGNPQPGYGMGQMFAFRGSATSNPIVLGVPVATSPAPGVTTQSPGELVFFFYHGSDMFDDTGVDKPIVIPSAPGLALFTKRGEGSFYHVVAQFNGNRYSFSFWTGVKLPPGATGNVSWAPPNDYGSNAGLVARILPYVPPPTSIIGRAFNRGFNEGFNGGFN